MPHTFSKQFDGTAMCTTCGGGIGAPDCSPVNNNNNNAPAPANNNNNAPAPANNNNNAPAPANNNNNNAPAPAPAPVLAPVPLVPIVVAPVAFAPPPPMAMSDEEAKGVVWQSTSFTHYTICPCIWVMIYGLGCCIIMRERRIQRKLFNGSNQTIFIAFHNSEAPIPSQESMVFYDAWELNYIRDAHARPIAVKPEEYEEQGSRLFCCCWLDKCKLWEGRGEPPHIPCSCSSCPNYSIRKQGHKW